MRLSWLMSLGISGVVVVTTVCAIVLSSLRLPPNALMMIYMAVAANVAGWAVAYVSPPERVRYRPSYLIEREDVWGDGTRVAPPAIGEVPSTYYRRR